MLFGLDLPDAESWDLLEIEHERSLPVHLGWVELVRDKLRRNDPFKVVVERLGLAHDPPERDRVLLLIPAM